MVYYVIEHMEEGLSDWCRLEYEHMLEIVTLPDKVVFTKVVDKSTRNFLYRPNSLVSMKSLEEMLTEGGNKRDGDNHTAAPTSTGPCLDLSSAVGDDSSSLKFEFSRVCLLDMKAESGIIPSDSESFDVVVFGGILGNVHVLPDGSYSSDDKTALVRDLGFTDNRRHLGELQMTTDTAVFVTHAVLKGQQQLHQIPYVDHPEIGDHDDDDDENDDDEDEKECTVMEGFRYVALPDGRPLLPKGKAALLKNSMDFDLQDELL